MKSVVANILVGYFPQLIKRPWWNIFGSDKIIFVKDDAAKEMLKVGIAFNEGANIQCRTHNSYRWDDIGNPSWDSDTVYRVRPKTNPDTSLEYTHHNKQSIVSSNRRTKQRNEIFERARAKDNQDDILAAVFVGTVYATSFSDSCNNSSDSYNSSSSSCSNYD